MSDKDGRLRGIRVTKKSSRAKNYELWSSDPLPVAIRHALDAREWTISDLSRAIGSQPSLVSRWMMGARPSVESLLAISQALSIDIKHLLVLADYLPPELDDQVDRRTRQLQLKLEEVTMTDDRFGVLNALIEHLRKQGPPVEQLESTVARDTRGQ